MVDLATTPDWVKGGRGSASAFNAVKAVAARAQRAMNADGIRDSSGSAARRRSSGLRRFLAIITASSLQGGHTARWNYTASRAQVNSSGIAEALAGETAITAVNLLEMAHIAEPAAETPWYVWGIDIHDSALTATLTPLPVAGGASNGAHAVDTPVTITERWKPDGTVVYTFEMVGSVHVAC